jgi:nicotinamide-nucleotide amidase
MATKSLIAELAAADVFIATAESLTGGLVAAHLTDESGSSSVFLGGVIAYQNRVKQELLGVSPSLMEQQGAVDAEVAAQMAIGVRQRFAKINQVALEKVVGVSTTGVAGPGPQEGKEPGTVFIGVSSRTSDVVYSFEFVGDRGAVREQSVAAVMHAIREQLQLLGG